MNRSILIIPLLCGLNRTWAQPAGPDFYATCGSFMGQTDGYQVLHRPVPSPRDTAVLTVSVGSPYVTTVIRQTGVSGYKSWNNQILGGSFYQEGYSVSKRTILAMAYGRKLSKTLDLGTTVELSQYRVLGEGPLPISPTVRLCFNKRSSDRAQFGTVLEYEQRLPQPRTNLYLYGQSELQEYITLWGQVGLNPNQGISSIVGIQTTQGRWTFQSGLDLTERNIGFGFVYHLQKGRLHISWMYTPLLGFKPCIGWSWAI